DFRSKEEGLYDMVKRQFPGTFRSGRDLFDAELLRSRESIRAFYLFMGSLKELILNATPTATHFFLKKLADMKKLTRVYTQNVDNLEELDARLEQGRRPHTIGQLKPTVLLYGDEHPKGYEISQIAAQDENRADCLVVMGTSLRIPGVRSLIKNFSRAVHDRNGYVILVNKSDVVRREWNGIIDYQIEGTCDEWVKLVEVELSKIEKKMTLKKLPKNIVVEKKESKKRLPGERVALEKPEKKSKISKEQSEKNIRENRVGEKARRTRNSKIKPSAEKIDRRSDRFKRKIAEVDPDSQTTLNMKRTKKIASKQKSTN
ncbi:14563_t:CDS:2, partial [Acaulospora colombiana]